MAYTAQKNREWHETGDVARSYTVDELRRAYHDHCGHNLPNIWLLTDDIVDWMGDRFIDCHALEQDGSLISSLRTDRTIPYMPNKEGDHLKTILTVWEPRPTSKSMNGPRSRFFSLFSYPRFFFLFSYPQVDANRLPVSNIFVSPAWA